MRKLRMVWLAIIVSCLPIIACAKEDSRAERGALQAKRMPPVGMLIVIEGVTDAVMEDGLGRRDSVDGSGAAVAKIPSCRRSVEFGESDPEGDEVASEPSIQFYFGGEPAWPLQVRWRDRSLKSVSLTAALSAGDSVVCDGFLEVQGRRSDKVRRIGLALSRKSEGCTIKLEEIVMNLARKK